jgi:hypothetical protein
MTMQGSDSRRGLAFAGVVAVLAAVGIYLTMMSSSEPQGGTREQAVSGSSAPSAAPSPVPSQVASTPAEFDVYSYLPLSRAELGAAADLARRFTVSYGSFQYGEDPAVFAGRLKVFATTEFGDELTRAVTAPALVDQNRADEVVSAGSATVKSIRDMTANSVVFVVDSVRHVTAKSGAKDQSDEYAVTVIKEGSDWRVYDLEPATAGQDGDTSP